MTVTDSDRRADLARVHDVARPSIGLAFGGIVDLDALADDCAHDSRYTFTLFASPLPLTGGVGSPVAAVAVN